MLTKMLFGLAADLLKAVDAVIPIKEEPMTLMRMSDFGTIWVSDLTPRSVEAQHGDTYYASRREVDESDELAEERKTQSKGDFITMKERNGIVLE